MGWNVPDDWGCYYNRCSRCGGRYHASEGGCGCYDSLEPCQCGRCNWDGDRDFPRCRDCSTGPYVSGRVHVTKHTARKAHGHNIRPGDRYRRVVSFGHYPGGAFTLNIRKSLVERAAPPTRYERMLAEPSVV